MPCGWEGNRRSGVALAMHHRLVFDPPTGSQPRQGEEHPAYALLWSMVHIPLPHLTLPNFSDDWLLRGFEVCMLQDKCCALALTFVVVRYYCVTINWSGRVGSD